MPVKRYTMKGYSTFIEGSEKLDSYGRMQIVLDGYTASGLTAIVFSVKGKRHKIPESVENALRSGYGIKDCRILQFDIGGHTDLILSASGINRLEAIAFFLHEKLQRKIGCVVCTAYEDASDVQLKAEIAIGIAEKNKEGYHIYEPKDIPFRMF